MRCVEDLDEQAAIDKAGPPDARGAIDQRFARRNRASLPFQNFLCSTCTREARRHEMVCCPIPPPVTDRLSRGPAQAALRPCAGTQAREAGSRSTHAITTRVFWINISGSSDTRTVADIATRRGKVLRKLLYISELARRPSLHRLRPPPEDLLGGHVNASLKATCKHIARLHRRPRFSYVVGIST
jgi:hypothetical protein